MIRGDRKLGPIVSSILRFVKPHELKEVWSIFTAGHDALLLGTQQAIPGATCVVVARLGLDSQQDPQPQAGSLGHGNAGASRRLDGRARVHLL